MFDKKDSTIGQLDFAEIQLINEIKDKTDKNNLDNISRTDAYFSYYNQNPEILWSFLASMVSRNAGWNMCDLKGALFPKLLKKNFRKKLFFTYERANWLIFSDAYPQLLLYQYSTKIKRPMFHLLKFFHVSTFMVREWKQFWRERNMQRLMIALIINEQNIIQKPVIKHPIYNSSIFQSPLFLFQDWFHFSAVLFPTCKGELFGASVNGFKSVSKRIDLGKRLAEILFNKGLYPSFYEFARKTVHTGSRYDYEHFFIHKPKRTTPFLRCAYPIINHHRHQLTDWSNSVRLKKTWINSSVKHHHPIHLTKWYLDKQKQISKAVFLKEKI
ncbi:hypothetical protein J2Z40_001900 [Cytobacillus eiseniae]|uniref:DUF2515 domain-containing protein n=1 Tax=Cytobacillus eiseniae TaxID=762947 RepID=A0ABS4REK1_9BACI|nr:DUF2515 domain-containing protein [Cytobacillus eiseniae]MBP2241338.1 hypothetical protein [Cytobacillus eiseniae]